MDVPTLLINLPVNDHLSCFQCLATINSAITNIYIQVSLRYCIFLEVELLGHTVTLCLTLCQFPFEKLVIFYYLESYGISPRALLILSWFWLTCKLVFLAFPLIWKSSRSLQQICCWVGFSQPFSVACTQISERLSLPAAFIREWLSKQALMWCHVGLAVIPVCQGLGM